MTHSSAEELFRVSDCSDSDRDLLGRAGNTPRSRQARPPKRCRRTLNFSPPSRACGRSSSSSNSSPEDHCQPKRDEQAWQAPLAVKLTPHEDEMDRFPQIAWDKLFETEGPAVVKLRDGISFHLGGRLLTSTNVFIKCLNDSTANISAGFGCPQSIDAVFKPSQGKAAAGAKAKDERLVVEENSEKECLAVEAKAEAEQLAHEADNATGRAQMDEIRRPKEFVLADKQVVPDEDFAKKDEDDDEEEEEEKNDDEMPEVLQAKPPPGPTAFESYLRAVEEIIFEPLDPEKVPRTIQMTNFPNWWTSDEAIISSKITMLLEKCGECEIAPNLRWVGQRRAIAQATFKEILAAQWAVHWFHGIDIRNWAEMRASGRPPKPHERFYVRIARPALRLQAADDWDIWKSTDLEPQPVGQKETVRFQETSLLAQPLSPLSEVSEVSASDRGSGEVTIGKAENNAVAMDHIAFRQECERSRACVGDTVTFSEVQGAKGQPLAQNLQPCMKPSELDAPVEIPSAGAAWTGDPPMLAPLPEQLLETVKTFNAETCNGFASCQVSPDTQGATYIGQAMSQEATADMDREDEAEEDTGSEVEESGEDDGPKVLGRWITEEEEAARDAFLERTQHNDIYGPYAIETGYDPYGGNPEMLQTPVPVCITSVVEKKFARPVKQQMDDADVYSPAEPSASVCVETKQQVTEAVRQSDSDLKHLPSASVCVESKQQVTEAVRQSDSDLKRLLDGIGLSSFEKVLREKGVVQLKHVLFFTDDDLESMGFNLVQLRMLQETVKQSMTAEIV